MEAAVQVLMLVVIFALFILPFYFAFSQPTRFSRLWRIGLIFLVGVATYAFLCWLWSKTPEPNDAGENLAIGEELIFFVCLIAAIIASIRKDITYNNSTGD